MKFPARTFPAVGLSLVVALGLVVNTGCSRQITATEPAASGTSLSPGSTASTPDTSTSDASTQGGSASQSAESATPSTSQASSSASSPAASTAASGSPSATASGTKSNASAASSAPGGASSRCVALTFDDGPGPYTDQLLKELTSQNVPATFFMIGQSIPSYPQHVKDVINTPGMEVGNHSLTHPPMTTLDNDQVTHQISVTADRIKALTGKRPTLMRPPYGDTSKRVNKVIGQQGEAVILWDVDSLDWKYRNVAKDTAEVLKEVKPGSIILMHEIHKPSVEAVPGIIAKLKARGYCFQNVTQLLGNPRPGMVYTDARR